MAQVQNRRAQDRGGLLAIDLSELMEEIADFIRGVWRYRWEAIVVAWVVCLVSWWLILSMPDVYRASSRVHIDTADALRPLLKGMAIESDILARVNVMLNSVLSRPTLEKIAAKSGFDLGDTEPAEIDSYIKQLGDSLVLDLDKEQILEISIEHTNPSVAYAVVDVIIDIFVQDLMGSTRRDTRSAQDFLEKKLVEYEGLLAEAEERLADFKKRNIGQMPGERGGYYERLQHEMQELEDLEVRIRLARERRDALEMQMAGEEPVFGVMANTERAGVITPQIAALEAELTQLRLSYTDSHPDVIRVKQLLERMREEAQERQATMGVPAATGVDQNPVYQQMKIQFSQAELELSQLQVKRAQQARVVSDLTEKINTIPEIEAELKKLNRNYDVYQTQYNELVERLEQARLSEDVEQRSSGFSFRLIDPPSVGNKPVGPKRVLLATGALLAALAVGVGIAIMRSITTPVFYTSHKLERLFGVPVLGTVKKIETPMEVAKARVRSALLSISVIGLVAFYAAIVVFHEAGSRFASQFATTIG